MLSERQKSEFNHFIKKKNKKKNKIVSQIKNNFNAWAWGLMNFPLGQAQGHEKNLRNEPLRLAITFLPFFFFFNEHHHLTFFFFFFEKTTTLPLVDNNNVVNNVMCKTKQ